MCVCVCVCVCALDRLLAEGPRLSDIAQPPVVQSHAPTVQYGMMTNEMHSINHVPPHTHTQPGLGTQQFQQNGIGTLPQQNETHLPTTQTVFQPPVQPQHGIMPIQHGMAPVQQQPGIMTQPTMSTGMGTPHTGIAIPHQNGMGTQQPSSTLFSSNPGHYEVCVYNESGHPKMRTPF